MISPSIATRIERWPIDRLIPYARNSRTHSDPQVAQIAASIAEFGFNNPILVDTNAGIIAGHGRLLAARKLNLGEVPVIVLDHLSEIQKRAFILADNRLAELAGWDDDMLRLELKALEEADLNLDLTGFSDEDLARLLADEEPSNGLIDEDDAPAVPETPVNVAGDLWLMGNHRLLCGDATAAGDVEKLLDRAVADLAFTDPPYNVNYAGYTEERMTIQGDRMDAQQFVTFLNDTFQNLRAAVKPGATVYISHASSWQREFQSALEAAGFAVRTQIIWAKNTFAWGFGRYKFQHEPIFYCHVAGQTDPWYGDRSQSTLWQENKPAANREHPTAKPVALIERALINSSKAGDVVVDLFGGSGSTLIACQRRNRHARLLEIDPKYADVIVRRWQEYTGKTATLNGDGSTFDEIAVVRLQPATQAESSN
jgi:DNA modification methylase